MLLTNHCYFWMLDDSNDRVSLNGDQRRTTNANIRRVIGSYEDFVLTSLSLQNNSTVFIDKTQKERKDLLAQFMGMGIFDQLYTLAHEEISDISAILKDFRKTKILPTILDPKKLKHNFRSGYRLGTYSKALESHKCGLSHAGGPVFLGHQEDR